jgi:hypothetical protein
MPTEIKCPGCGHQFEPNDAIREEVQRELLTKAKEWQKRKDEEFKQKEAALLKQLQQKQEEADKRIEEEKIRLQQTMEATLRKTIASDFENQLKLLQESCSETEEKLKLSRRKELEYLQKEQELKNKEEELELQLQKRLIDERNKLQEQIRSIEEQRIRQMELEFQLKLAEKEKQLEDQRKLAEEMRRKAEQGSMQLQGEVQELLLEEILRTAFVFDKIEPVGKGVRGADCIQVICNNHGQECGKIIYESKRTLAFSVDWIDKLKADMRAHSADVAIIVTQVLPRDMERFGEREGVYICTFLEVRSLAAILRSSVMKVYAATKSQENKGEKMHMLYDYLTSVEFSEQWKAIREGFLSMKMSIQKERDTMEKLWKAREKQLEKVLLNAAHIKGSIEGIAGSDAVNLSLLEEEVLLAVE